ncbi:unnamed protein product [Phytophthora fragariaefolia]|uniref:Unnamed protein product n=1 Tax=Phytophthora fragariaefolia TaxID=1490495 RepID=A0A9W6XLA2_9STRA|nr:unnamed protein product [Phytophthora fragariaefolia]
MSTATIMCLSIGAFAFLEYHPWAQEMKVAEEKAVSAGGSIQDQKRHQIDVELDGREAEEDTLLSQSCSESCPSSTSASTVRIPSPTTSLSAETMSGAAVFRQVWPLLACQWVLAAFSFGWLPSTMPYVYKKFAVRFNLAV